MFGSTKQFENSFFQTHCELLTGKSPNEKMDLLSFAQSD